MKLLKGIPSSDGITIGRCYILDRQKIHVRRYSINASEVESEKVKLAVGVEKTAEFIKTSKNMSEDFLAEEHAFIFDIYLMLLRDNMLIGAAEQTIENELVNAEYALSKAGAYLMGQFDKSANEYLRERKSDINNIVQKVLRFMSDQEMDTVLDAANADIIIAHDLTPSDTSQMTRKNIKGFATDLGSRTSHTSILARSLGIPAVVGLEDIASAAKDGDLIIIDGFEGVVIVDPDEQTLDSYAYKDSRYAEYIKDLAKLKDEESVTKDGERISTYSNIELNDELYLSNNYRHDGVGLYRTEYIYMEHGNVSEDKQFRILKAAALENGGLPLVVRTFDLGADKLSKYMPHPKEQNPAMGLRAVRYSLKYHEFFNKQLRAILRASAYGDVHVLFPMISGMEEYHKCLDALEKAKAELRAEGVDFDENIKKGVMMELPSLAVISDFIAAEVDFFSVGTNDLIQYTLGIDRNNEFVAYLYRPTHPAVIRTLKKIIESANAAGIECTVCGEIAGEPKYIPMLIGLGYRSLSMSPAGLLKARMIIRALNISDCHKLVDELLDMKIARLAEKHVEKFIEEKCSDVYFH
ncbi:phosphoenolpyruvate-protein phosphotransferase [Denitrovibrio acetiphilus DSM 12809]|uniref:Phosphoenolpyruvate-protein phosphotransferase n=1 Tax=Denitrovibrio acetiphilus (strain DSM 12809 / NBRC 114555 / N2460) TaxID=522772 RepID=D4H7U2_DENA2|nr:phosphoenolpyruvate--protein phosphotransferase [Denitrovibrio acetiphilus]ADD68091.1 phosphoenolpyruvate-protein phosphotransferase [Denitrovibrio acetiphilus DSM 12809]